MYPPWGSSTTPPWSTQCPPVTGEPTIDSYVAKLSWPKQHKNFDPFLSTLINASHNCIRLVFHTRGTTCSTSKASFFSPLPLCCSALMMGGGQEVCCSDQLRWCLICSPRREKKAHFSLFPHFCSSHSLPLKLPVIWHGTLLLITFHHAVLRVLHSSILPALNSRYSTLYTERKVGACKWRQKPSSRLCTQPLNRTNEQSQQSRRTRSE